MRYVFISLSLLALPGVVLAQEQSLEGILLDIQNAINLAIPILIGLGLLAFLYGLVRFIFHAGDESAIEEGRRIMVWGIASIFVMVSIWGLIALIADVLNIGVGGSAEPPTIDCSYLQEFDPNVDCAE